MKVAVVGEAPSKGTWELGLSLPTFPSDLARLAGCGLATWTSLFDAYNVFEAWPGKAGKGDAFPLQPARLRCAVLKSQLAGREVVLLGQRVAAAWGADQPLFAWRARLAVAPHPSKVSHWWNDPANRAQAARFWKELLDEARRRQDAVGEDAQPQEPKP